MESIDNNQFELKPVKNKRKIAAPCPNAYLNPALDLLVNEDPMCNTAMEIVPNKKRKRTRSCSDITTFENCALDLGANKVHVNEFLARELDNVKKNVRLNHAEETATNSDVNEPVYSNVNIVRPLSVNSSVNSSVNLSQKVQLHSIQNNATQDIICTETSVPNNNTMDISLANEDIDSGISVLDQKSLNENINVLSPITNIETNITNQVFVNNMNNSSNLNLSFIDRLALESPNLSNQSLFYDDDLNESNIMEIKTITIITKKKRVCNNKNTNPFLDPNLVNTVQSVTSQNPFLNLDETKPELEYNDDVLNRPAIAPVPFEKVLEPRRLFGDTNSTISTVNESLDGHHEYENVDNYRSESPLYENIEEVNDFNKQSRILGHDVSHFSAVDIMNLNKNSQQNCTNESNDSKNNKSKSSFLKVGNKLSKKVFKTLKKTFKGEKSENNISLNPYEVPRKASKPTTAPKETGIENPALNLDNSDEIEIEEIDDEHQYETVKTLRNTHLNMNITPLKERNDNADISHNKTNTPGKKVRFDSTLNQEKVITGNSFDYDIQSPGFDVKLDKYHDELENCINERKFLQQNM
ncbi:unnamed protein product [Arctia plantaginis]|uniref:Uncharacterized protein n=1 Tax=Arctia plantaginis TaxID=874455 RepID=A0A8S1AKR6_ARCPL|nr:unnamed protein product [Arctia plantaginis]